MERLALGRLVLRAVLQQRANDRTQCKWRTNAVSAHDGARFTLIGTARALVDEATKQSYLNAVFSWCIDELLAGTIQMLGVAILTGAIGDQHRGTH
ncbi:hypothetical protein D3C77_500830 [compost metagenome]